jgi:hypothetical protein
MLSLPHRILHHVATWLLAASGVSFLWMKYLLEPSDDPFTVVNHPWQPYALDLHVLAAPLWLLAIGMMLEEHVLGRLRNPLRRRGRYGGAGMAGLLLPMVASGYLLQVVTAEGWRPVLVWTHVITAGAYLTLFLGHMVMAGRTVRRRRAGADDPARRIGDVPAAMPPAGTRRRAGSQRS